MSVSASRNSSLFITSSGNASSCSIRYAKKKNQDYLFDAEVMFTKQCLIDGTADR